MRLDAPRGWDEDQVDPDLLDYGGADIVLYRVPEPLEFLRQQRNPHRIQVPGRQRASEGLANALGYLWDSGYKQSRLAWQRIFSAEARGKAVTEAPELRQTPPHRYRTEFAQPPQFEFLPGYDRVAAFRYPLWDAKPIQPPADVRLSGSSSEFLKARKGDVHIPLGTLAPGLYLVEAYIGKHRATTVVFVSDTVAVTKTSGGQVLIWTARRDDGTPVPQTRLLVSDGVGILESGTSDARGLLLVTRPTPERSYVLGQDPAGGVFVSENFYYDSEIHAPKLYAFTDRPLYRPGDTVRVKLMGRVFEDARRSTPLTQGVIDLTVLDPAGTPITRLGFLVSAAAGGDTEFSLPGDAMAGGYTLRMTYQGALYAGAFRVAQYAKPHFDIEILPDQPGFKTGEPVTGQARLSYPGGRPVANAQIELSLRAQALTMAGEEPGPRPGLFPHKLLETTLTSDEEGQARFELPPAALPSRYVISLRAHDQESYRVTALREILIQPGQKAYRLVTARQLTRPGEAVPFGLEALNQAPGEATQWEAVRLEDQSRLSGPIRQGAFRVPFPQAGTYTVSVRSPRGEDLGAIPHWVAGPELKAPPGNIRILLDKEEYDPGETAVALISFPAPVREALVTLERDRVERHGLLTQGGDWIRLTRLDDHQWRAEIPLPERYAPNMTLSLAYVRDGDHVFQNKGLRVRIPRIQVRFGADKAQYAPGDEVRVEVTTQRDGRPLAARLAVAVVDEMVYVLQPEIAPDIGDFFHHLRRNQVRTAASLAFHTYDKSLPASGEAPAPRVSNRLLKMLERPRRENIDTALWLPDLATDADGKARFSFRMPASLTRWRITGRAMSDAGNVGQGLAFVTSSQDYYLKWSGPTDFRQGDQPLLGLLAFNQGQEAREGILVARAPGLDARQPVTLKPGANRVPLPFQVAGNGVLVAELEVDGRVRDRLETPYAALPPGWLFTESRTLDLGQAQTPLNLPEGARRVRLNLVDQATDSFLGVLDDLLDYPYGCVEQTASRLLPLSLAHGHLDSLDPGDAIRARLRDRIAHQRLRLARLAGPNAQFGWWGDQTRNDPFLTAYAYYTDHRALKALGIPVAARHWDRLLETYRDGAEGLPLLHKALILWLARDMGLPVRTLLEGALEDASNVTPDPAEAQGPLDEETSRLLEAPWSPDSEDMGLLLLRALVQREGLTTGAQALAGQAEAARQRLLDNPQPLAQAVLFATRANRGGPLDPLLAEPILARASPRQPTIDRALTLLLVDQALGKLPPPSRDFQPGPGWREEPGAAGGRRWYWQDAGPPVIAPATAPAPSPRVRISYERPGLGESTLPLVLERRLYRLETAPPTPEEETRARAATREETPPPPEDDGEATSAEETGGEEDPEAYDDGEVEEFTTLLQAIPVPEPWQVRVGDLYLDEIRVAPAAGRTHAFGLVDVPLPAGADVEPTTWGIGVLGLEAYDEDGRASAVELADATFAPGQQFYSLPLDHLTGPRVFRHLVRFGQAGAFSLPPARYVRLYQPADQALEADGQPRSVRVD